MTIIRGISLENDVQDLDLNIGQSGLSGGSLLRLSRQNSLLPEFGSLPDFSNLLLTPNVQQSFDFEESIYPEDMPVKTQDPKSLVSAFQVGNTPIKTEDVSATTTESELTSFIAAVTQATSQYNQSSSIPSIADIKQESLDSVTENQVVTIHNDGSIQMRTYESAQDVSLASQNDYGLQELQSRIHKACRELNIPKNPWLWSEEQVNKWIHWLFTTHYEIVPMFALGLDGTKLCMAKDLASRVNGQERAAEIISIEIDLWKQAFSIETEMMYAQQQQQQQQQEQQYLQMQQQPAYVSSEEQRIYTDLSESRPVTSHVQQQPQVSNCTISVIPTPVTTHSINAMSMTLNELHQQRYYEYSQSVRSGYPMPMQQVSPTSSFSSSQGWDSPSGSVDSADYTSMDEDTRECSPVPQTNTSAVRGPIPHSRNSIKLWQFLKSLLEQPNLTCIRWVDREKGIFKIEDSQRVAKMWGQRKNRPAMNYDKLSRSIRQYYKKKIIKKTDNSKRLVYQFCAPYL